jgi:unsaturated chondroitin disaccharide hydrolase
MYGFPLVYRYNGSTSLIELSMRLADYFLARLPADHVCCWDLVFTAGEVERDTSAAAIAVCGLLEMARQLPITDASRARYEASATAILLSLIDNYALGEHDAGDGLLREAVYHMPKKIGVRERVIWGDYFYLEALMRCTRIWDPYW